MTPYPRDCQIWCARDPWDESIVGLLITEPGDIDKPRYLVRVMRDNEGDAYDLAWSILRNPACAYRIPHKHLRVIDFARYFAPGASEMIPGFLYGLCCRPAGSDGTDELGDDLPVSPNPPCPVRLKMWQQATSDGRPRRAG